MSLINKKLYNYRISQIINSFLKVGYINFGDSLIDSRLEHNIGIPQGALLSPFFCNILFHELDLFVKSLYNRISNNRKEVFIIEKSKNQVHYLTTTWANISNLIKNKNFNININKLLEPIRFQGRTLKKSYYSIINNQQYKLMYIRYADDFLCGFIGPKSEAINILIYISHYVELALGMKLNIEKTNVRHHEKGVYFLGYKIWKNYGLNIKYEQKKNLARLNFSIPLEKLFHCFS
jgi:hypothetical protein